MQTQSDNNTVNRRQPASARSSSASSAASQGEEGFTLVELTIVLLILGILLTIAVPSYLCFKDRADKTAAKADVAQAMRSVVSYGADNYPERRERPERGITRRQRLLRHRPRRARDEVRRVDLDRPRRAVRDQPGRLRGLRRPTSA